MRYLSAFFAFCVHSFFFGLAAVATIFWWHSRDLPSAAELAKYKHATLSRVHSSDGAVLAEFARERRVFTPADEIPDLVLYAFVSAEDKNFFIHDGVDGLAFAKAMVDNVQRFMRRRRLRGASTLTQQVVKNFKFSGVRAISRKIKEATLAFRLETALASQSEDEGLVLCARGQLKVISEAKLKAKCKIAELYLNEIFFGLHSYGVGSAAKRYFGKKLEELTPAEAAYIAALPKAPSDYHPVKQKRRATIRRDYVLKEMFENGYISKAQYDDAIATKLITLFDAPKDTAGSDEKRRPDLSYFSEEIRRFLIKKFTTDEADGEDIVYGGGLSIRSTVHPKLQDLARRVLQQRLWEYTRERGYNGPIAKLEFGEKLRPTDEKAWRAALAKIKIPRDVTPWRPAVVLAVTAKGAEIGIEGVTDGKKILLPFKDVKDWAAPRLSVDEKGDATLGPAPKKPSDVWKPGDVIYVAPAVNSDGVKTGGWSMRQIPEVNGAIVAMDPHTGRVLAMQGGFSFEASEFNRATQAERQPGSAFKPFVYAAALEHIEPSGPRKGLRAYFPNSIVLDAPLAIPQGDGKFWKPRNYSGRFYGPVPFRWGIEKSHNLMTVRIAQDVGLETIAKYAVRFGVYDNMPPLFSYALGAGETTLLKMTASYAMFVNGGKRIEPTLIDRIQDRFGVTIFRHDDRICLGCKAAKWDGKQEPYVPDEGEQVMDPITAFQVVSMMEGVTVRGTASKIGKALPFAVAGKTGTTNDGLDAWFIGFTPDLVMGCFIGFDKPKPMGKNMSGGKLCAPVFVEFMKGAAKIGRVGADGGEFRKPSGAAMVKIDRETGCVVPDGYKGSQYIWEAFRASEAPYVGTCPKGGIAGTLGKGKIRTTPTDGAVDPDATIPTPVGADAPTTPGADGAKPGGEPDKPKPPTDLSIDDGSSGGLY
ncbi:MAG: transglycosylase domain-containing protein [Neomegalonema sp.]|nr:transglycosylase domain-containing protein [Neomegalonema sp.]